jgi:regulatory protein
LEPPKRNKPPKRALDAQGGRDAALRLLSRREHAAAELQFKLTRRGLSDDEASDVVGAMAQAGWQSDERYAEMLARNRMEQGYGPLRIRMELEAAGIDDARIAAALNELDVDWSARVLEVWRRRFKSPAKAAKDWQQQYRFLASRGFSAEQVRSALKGPAEPLD